MIAHVDDRSYMPQSVMPGDRDISADDHEHARSRAADEEQRIAFTESLSLPKALDPRDLLIGKFRKHLVVAGIDGWHAASSLGG